MELCLSFHLAEPLGLIRLFVVGVFAQTFFAQTVAQTFVLWWVSSLRL